MIVIVCGLPGTGKSFFAARLSEQLGAVCLSTDEVRVQLRRQGAYGEDAKQQVYDVLERMMVEQLGRGADVVVDGTFHLRDRRAQFARRAEMLRQPLFFIEMQAGEDAVRRRVAGKRPFSEADFAVYRKIRTLFEPLDEPHLTLDSANGDIHAMLARAQRYLHGQ